MPPVEPHAWEEGCREGLLLFLGKAPSSRERQKHILSCCEVSFSPPQGSTESCGLCGFEPPCPAGSVQRVKLTALSPRRPVTGLMTIPTHPSCFSSKMKAHLHVASPSARSHCPCLAPSHTVPYGRSWAEQHGVRGSNGLCLVNPYMGDSGCRGPCNSTGGFSGCFIAKELSLAAEDGPGIRWRAALGGSGCTPVSLHHLLSLSAGLLACP